MNFSKLFNLFRNSPKPTTPELNIVHYWEDDYCQVELLPVANKEYIQKELEAVSKFADEHYTEQGFTDVYARDSQPDTTKSEEFLFSTFQTMLLSNGFKHADEFYFEGELITSSKTKAFGFSKFAICVDVEEGFISNIWLVTRYGIIQSQFEIAINTLYEIGESYDLVLVDWNSLELVDLKNKSEIRAYLEELLSNE